MWSGSTCGPSPLFGSLYHVGQGPKQDKTLPWEGSTSKVCILLASQLRPSENLDAALGLSNAYVRQTPPYGEGGALFVKDREARDSRVNVGQWEAPVGRLLFSYGHDVGVIIRLWHRGPVCTASPAITH